MASTTDLGKILLTNGGEYDPEAVYEQLTMVMYENSTYVTLKTVQGITPTDDHENYQLMAKGFDATALKEVEAEDTSGVLGEAGSTVSAQDLVDWVVDQAANKLLKLTDLVSVQTNDPTKGVSAALAYTMGQKIDEVNSNLAITQMLYGSQVFSGSSTVNIQFDTPFETVPIVMVCNANVNYLDSRFIGISNVTKNGFTLGVYNSNGNTQAAWVALGRAQE